ncbi:MAG: hypothetical protein LBH05_07755 [Deferribacteraceae bacterium]|jgi:hypothetical protein|nr:hypothetical protein [Deferribacteraceae bacterium]
MKKFTAILSVLSVCVFLSACSRNARIIDINTSIDKKNAYIIDINTPVEATADNAGVSIEQAILNASSAIGWQAIKESEGNIKAVLRNRNHMVAVNIKYTESGYSIAYADSVNLRYNPKQNSIHRNYNKWVVRLNKWILFYINGNDKKDLQKTPKR